MSANAASLPCPICLHTGVFDSVKSLRDKLIFVSTNTLTCPVCQEEVTGLDKLTIHLFTHVELDSIKRTIETPKKYMKDDFETTKSIREHERKEEPIVKKSGLTSSCSTPMKYVKIYPKLPVVASPVPVIDVMLKRNDGDCKLLSSPGSLPLAQPDLSQPNTTCNICGLQFVDANILKIHRGLIHNIEENSDQNFTRYHCHICPKNFKMRGSLMVHLRVAHFGFSSNKHNDQSNNEIANNTPIEDTIKDEKMNVERNENKQWQCDVCRKCFTTKYFLKKHKRLHTGETPYACTQCNKSFTFQQSYHKHLLYHNDEKPHTCSYCGRAFKELSTLHNHQRIHTGEKPFSCETCGKSFRQRVSYLVHRRIHTGAMPYRCTACDKSFRYKVSQRTHKCLAQPPGTVVRQSGDLVEKLLKNHDDSAQTIDEQVFPIHHNQNQYCIEVSKVNAEMALSGARLSLEDVVSENFTFIPETYVEESNHNCEMRHNITNEIDNNIADLIDSIPSADKDMPSPSEIFKNLNLTQEDEFSDIKL